MIGLFLAVCLAAGGGCDEIPLPGIYATPIACLFEAQPRAAEWQETHPKWRVRELRCRRADEKRA